MSRKQILMLIIMVLVTIGCSEKEQKTIDAVDLVPLDNEISGWTKNSAMQIAENETQLYSLIDGEAPDYINRGFVKCAFQSYFDNQQVIELHLRIFDQGDTLNAKSVYDFKAIGSEIPWTDGNAGEEARYKIEGFSYTLDFWDDRFYVYINITDNTQSGLDIAQMFALNISSAIRDTVSE
ncbi:MAG: DUF6599 family protein [candidate division WOR-3 bacterium]